MKYNYTKKSIILLVPLEFGFNDMFRNNILDLGYDVVSLSEKFKFKYSSIFQKITNSFYKIFLKKKDYKQKLIVKFQKEIVENIKNSLSNRLVDYVLVVRPDLWDINVVAKVANLGQFKICYQWDGIRRYPNVLPYLDLFDKVFLFDPKDIEEKRTNIELSTNFYFDNIPKTVEKKRKSLCYIGTFQPERMALLLDIIDHLKSQNISFDIYLYFDNSKDAKDYKHNKDIIILENRLPYAEMVLLIKNYSVILDLQNKLHQGLSFRHYECMYFGLKIITDNPEAKNYDFYHPNNTFVVDRKSLNEIFNFLSLPYYRISKEIINKYSFTNWLNRVLH